MGMELSGAFTEKLGPPPPERPGGPATLSLSQGPLPSTRARDAGPSTLRAGWGDTQPGRGAGHMRPLEATSTWGSLHEWEGGSFSDAADHPLNSCTFPASKFMHFFKTEYLCGLRKRSQASRADTSLGSPTLAGVEGLQLPSP